MSMIGFNSWEEPTELPPIGGFHDVESEPLHDMSLVVKQPKNVTHCSCCGQDRPFPTEPGVWEFTENIWMLSHGKEPIWIRVEVKLPTADDRDGLDGLRIWKDGEMIWWPNHAAWRKI